MTISEAVNLSINEFLSEDVLVEKHKKGKKGSNGKKETGVIKNAIKKKGGHRSDFDADHDMMVNPSLSNADNNELSDIADNDMLDIAAIAQKMYPDHTPEGAQSQLRKKLKGIHNDSGTPYKLKNREAKKLRKLLSSLLTNT